MGCTILGGRVIAARGRVDFRASLRLRGVLCLGGVRGVCLGQAVGGLRALVVAVDAVVVVEGPLVCAGGI